MHILRLYVDYWTYGVDILVQAIYPAVCKHFKYARICTQYASSRYEKNLFLSDPSNHKVANERRL